MIEIYEVEPGSATSSAFSDWSTVLSRGNARSIQRLDTTPEELDHTNRHHTSRLANRARRVAESKLQAKALCAVAQGPLMGKAYTRTLTRCATEIHQRDGRLTQYWCGYRWCLQCAAVRTARAFERYSPTVRLWANDGEAHLVTLTLPNVRGHYLRSTVRGMHRHFALAVRSLRRSGTVELIRATECTYSERTDSYHPHLHVVVRGAKTADALVKAWLRREPEAKRSAQQCLKADVHVTDNWFKYATKPTSERREDDGSPGVVPARALDVIYTALRGLHLLQPVGIRSARRDDADILEIPAGTPATTRVGETIYWQWDQQCRDWVDSTTGECLSGYQTSATEAKRLAMLEQRAGPLVPAPVSAYASTCEQFRWSYV
jgi:hypothetical protein